MGIRGELFSQKVILPNRTYFFNVKENRMGDLYLNIVESKNRDNGGFDRQSIILFSEDLQEFLKGFDESLKVLEKSAREKRQGGKGGAKREGNDKNAPRRDAGGERPRRERSSSGEARSDRPPRDRSNSERSFSRGGERSGRTGERAEKRDFKPARERSNSERSFNRGRERSDGARPPRSNSSARGRDRSERPGRDRGGERKPGSDRGKRVVVRKRD